MKKEGIEVPIFAIRINRMPLFLVVILCTFFLAEPGARAKSPPRSPNVILISLDTVAADHMSLYGYPRETTPTLDKFARENVFFENAVSQATFTLPSHYSLFTGAYPFTHGITDMSVMPSHNNPPSQMLSSKILTLTEYLKRAGYSTFSSATIWESNLNFTRGLDRGFDFLTGRLIDRIELPDSNEAMRRLLQTAAKRTPAFLFLYAWGGHDPYRPAPPFDRIFTPGIKKKPIQTEAEVYQMLCELRGAKEAAATLSQNRGNPERDLYWKQFDLKKKSDVDQVTGLYDGGLRTLDGKLKILFQLLKETGLYDQSIIIVTSDHGESLGDHGLFLHSTPFENEIHVPLIMKIPGMSSIAIRGLARSIDVLPTVLELLGLNGSANIEGVSLVSRMKGAGKASNSSYAVGMNSEALRSGVWKLIEWRDHKELYRLDEDPLEKHNVAAENAGKVTELSAELQALKARNKGTRQQ